MLTLLCVIYQLHKENAVYSELISKLFSLRVSEQAGSCPEPSHISSGPVMAVGPAPSGTASAVAHKGLLSTPRGPRRPVGVKKGGGAGIFHFLTPLSLLACPEYLLRGSPLHSRPLHPERARCPCSDNTESAQWAWVRGPSSSMGCCGWVGYLNHLEFSFSLCYGDCTWLTGFEE